MSSPSASSRSPRWFTRDLDLGVVGDDVLIVQRKVQTALTGVYDEPTAARVRGVQKRMGRKKQSGVVDAKTAEVLGEKPDAGKKPEWCGTGREDGEIRRILRLSQIEPLDSAIRRFQSANGLPLTGACDEATCRSIAERAF